MDIFISGLDISANSKQWEDFCRYSEEAWFWHTLPCLEYSLRYCPELNSRSLSFMVHDRSEVLAICPLVLEERTEDGSRMNFFMNSGIGVYGLAPALKNGLTPKQRKNVLKLIFDRVDLLASENKVGKVYMRFTPLAGTRHDFNFLVRYGFIDTSTHTQLVELDRDADRLFRDMRKGHKYDINRGRKEYLVEIIDSANVTREIFEGYRLLHRKAAGRETRPPVTFDMMYQWVVDGNAVLCAARKGDRYVGFALVVVFKEGAYYGSFAEDHEVTDTTPVAHVIQWKVMEYLRGKGIRYYETGEQHFSPQVFDLPTEKEKDISLFKRGFGGKTVTLYRAVKYYDMRLMKKELEGNIKDLMDHYSKEG